MHRLPPTPLQEAKQRLREEMLARRQAAFTSQPNAQAQMAALFLKNIALPPDSVIASYCAFRDEMDPALLTAQLCAQGYVVALPFIIAKKQPLRFHLHRPGDRLERDPMGILQPLPTASTVEPDILLVPLLAFDRQYRRMGYGGGYYDRTIEQLRQRKKIRAIGVAYAAQEVSQVPTGSHDVTLDNIVTEINFF